MARQQDWNIFRWSGWRRGLNRSVRSYRLDRDQLTGANNVRIGLSGEISQRPGVEETHDMLSNDECKGLWRYSRASDSVREWVCFRNGNVDGDGNGTAPFVNITTQTASSDTFVRFSQWKDTLAIPSDAATLKWYNSGDATTTRTADLSGDTSGGSWISLPGSASSGGDLLENKEYRYRFTWDYKMDNDFLGESHPHNDGSDPRDYDVLWGNTTPANKQIAINKAGTPSSLPTHVSGINVYRTDPLDTTGGPTTQEERKQSVDYFYLTTITAATYNTTGSGVALFTDDGSVDLNHGIPIAYDVMDAPPNSIMCFTHKERMWYVSGTSIWFSELNEPEAVGELSEIVLDRGNGENVIFATSWNDKFILAFEPNQTHLIGGADIETPRFKDPDDLVKEMLSHDMGCIAPETYSKVDNNAIWLSNQGVAWFDGTRIRDLATDAIRDYIDDIPDARKYYACGSFWRKEKQYWLAITPSGGTENTRVLIFDFRTQSWTENTFQNNSVDFGYNLFREVKGLGDPTVGEDRQLFGATYFSSTNQTTYGSLHKFNEVNYDLTDDANGNIVWSFETGDEDFGAPEVIKEFHAVLVTYYSDTNLTVDVTIDDGADTEQQTITVGTLRQTTLAKYLEADTLQIGRRIRVKISGTSRTANAEIQEIMVFYKPRPFIRKQPDV